MQDLNYSKRETCNKGKKGGIGCMDSTRCGHVDNAIIGLKMKEKTKSISMNVQS